MKRYAAIRGGVKGVELKRINRWFVPLFLGGLPLGAQFSPPAPVRYVTSDPTGVACSGNAKIDLRTPGGTLYTCQSGVYAAAGGGGSGTVTTVSVATANGFAGTVANQTTTPAISVKFDPALATGPACITTATGVAYACLGADIIPLFTGTPGSTTALFGDGSWKVVSSSVSALTPGTNTNAGTYTFSTGTTLTYGDTGTINAKTLAGNAETLYARLASPTFTGTVTLPALATLVTDLVFTDATYDIGKSGATRPRDIFTSRNASFGGTLTATGHTTFEGVTSTGATGTGKQVYDTSPTLVTPVLGAATATSVNGLILPCTPKLETSTYQVLAADFTGSPPCLIYSSSGTFTITLVASTSQPPAGQCVDFLNYGSGTVTISRSGQNINAGTASLGLVPVNGGQPSSARVCSDGSNYFTAGPVQSQTLNGTQTYVGTLTTGSNGSIQARNFQDAVNNKGYWDTGVSGINWNNINRVTTNINVAIDAVSSQSADLFEIRNSSAVKQTYVDSAFDLTIVGQKAATGTRYVCIDTAGKLVSSAAVCAGT